MWRTLDSYTIGVKPARLLPVVLRMKRDPVLWKHVSRNFLGRLRPTVLRMLGRIVQDAVLARDGKYRVFTTQVGNRDFELVTGEVNGRRSSLLAIRRV